MISYAFDIGTRSIGAVIFKKHDGQHHLLWSGVTIFGAPKRQRDLLKEAIKTRKRRERRKERLLKMRKWLEQEGLLPPYKEAAEREKIFRCNPQTLRQKALEAPLTPYEMGRLIYYIASHRGWKGIKHDACRNFKTQRDYWDALWHAQSRWHPLTLTPEKWAEISALLFNKTAQTHCPYHKNEKRLYQSQPLAEIAKAAEGLSSLTYHEAPYNKTSQSQHKGLSQKARSFLLAQLMLGKAIHQQDIAAYIKQPIHHITWPETTPAPLLMQTNAQLIKAGHFSHHWPRLSINQQDHLIMAIIKRDQARLIEFWPSDLPFSPQRLDRLLDLELAYTLADFGPSQAGQIISRQLSPKAPSLAQKQEGKKPLLFAQIFKRLIQKMQQGFGAPDQIIIELPECAQPATPQSKRQRLLDAQCEPSQKGALCPYSGHLITQYNLHSPEIEVDHIIPKSRGGGDTLENLTLCLARANRQKAGRTPFEAFGHKPNWPIICARVKHWPKKKQMRFLSTTKNQRFREMPNQASRDQTIHLARLAKTLAQNKYSETEFHAISAYQTHGLRIEFSLAKDRNDLRHHALDAALAYLCHEDTTDLAPAINRQIKNHTDPIFVATELGAQAKQGALAHYHSHIDIIKQHENTAWQICKAPPTHRRDNLVMRIKKGDVLHLPNERKGRKFLRIFRLQPSNGTIALGSPYLAGKEETTPLIYKSASQLQRLGAIKCRQRPLGYAI